MINIYVVYTDESQLDELRELKNVSLHFYNSIKDRTKASRLKSQWGAKLDPFAIVIKDEKPLKAFYSEANDVINDLKEYGKLFEHLCD